MGSIAKFADAEKDSVLNWYSIITDDYPPEPTFSSVYQWEKDRASIISIYDGKEKALIAYSKALTSIAKSHQKMAKDLSSFNTDSFKRLVVSLKSAREQIIDARDQYRKAFN